MIFVTVGTHEQSFKRLLLAVDSVAGCLNNQEFVVQTGYTFETLKNCRCEKFFAFEEMQQLYEQADVIITHGGPSSFMEALAKKKSPIVVPRQYRFHEHVNDHQLVFAKKIQAAGYPIEVVEEVADLKELIAARLKRQKTLKVASHNQEFINALRLELSSLF